MLTIGTLAPSFTLPSVHGPTYALKQFRHQKNVVLVFLPALATEINREQMQLYHELNSHLADFEAVLLGICTDPACLGDDFIRGLSYPILSDASPQGMIGRKCQTYDEQHQRMYRSIIIVDKPGKIALYHRADEQAVIGADVIFKTLAQLKE